MNKRKTEADYLMSIEGIQDRKRRYLIRKINEIAFEEPYKKLVPSMVAFLVIQQKKSGLPN